MSADMASAAEDVLAWAAESLVPLEIISPPLPLDRFSQFEALIKSLRNQGMDRLGTGLVVTGRDFDGIVQAIEDPAAEYLIGVQWHPEFLLYLSGQRALFRELVRCAHKHMPDSQTVGR